MPGGFMEVTIRADQDLTDQLIGILSQIGVEGFWEDDGQIRCYIHGDRWDDQLRDEIRRMVGFIARGSSSPTPAIAFDFSEDRNWNEAWEKTIRPIRVSDRIVVTPSWADYEPSPDDVVLVIDPKMSFGTGHHETTRLSLKLIESNIRPAIRCLDVGSGTGILGIAACKLGAASCLSVDVDEWAYRNAQENIRLNGVESYVRLLHGSLPMAPRDQFDMIVANIQLDVIIALMEEMTSRLAPGGVVILSGLLAADEDQIRKLLNRHRLTVKTLLAEGEWIALAAGAELTEQN
ncbi:MAG: 50S ribosomal protein L11 methyltransferase [Ignavibacteria bacterium]|nr:50S ribosomal protein L11 methyltransferase [Ignavibacteria bacterium]